MKALVFWNDGIKIGEVQKMDFEKANRDYRQPELIYEVVDVIDCKKNELDYKEVLGTEFNYILNNVGTTWFDESYVCPITEEQYKQLMNLLNVHIEEEQKIIKKCDNLLVKKREADKETLKDVNLNFANKTFKIDNKTTLEITGIENLRNTLKVEIDNSEDIATVLYKIDKVFLDFKNRDKIEITNKQQVIDYLWSIFGYKGNAELYKYTTEYEANYCD